MRPKLVVGMAKWQEYRQSRFCSDPRDENGTFTCDKCGHDYPWELGNVVYRGPWMYCARCDDLWPKRKRRRK